MKSIKRYTALISCPSDCEAHKDIVIQTIEIINRFCEAFLDSRIEFLYYKENLPTGSDIEAQQVINKNIKGRFDIYIGLFWSKLGTPTRAAVSGAVEELDIAYEEKVVNSRLGIHVYFCLENVPSDIFLNSDPKGIGWLKQYLKDKGTLYGSFTSTIQLQQLLSVDLVDDLRRLGSDTGPSTGAAKLSGSGLDGIISYLDSISDGNKLLTAHVLKMVGSMSHFREALDVRTSEMSRIKAMNKPFAEKGALVGVYKRIASDMTELQARLEEFIVDTTPVARQVLVELELMTNILGAIRRLPDVKQLYTVLEGLRETTVATVSQFGSTKATLVGLPAMEKGVLESRARLIASFAQMEEWMASLVLGLDRALVIYKRL